VSKTVPANDGVPKAGEDLQALVHRAENGDQTALPELRELLKLPGAVDLLGGDLARRAQETLIAQFSGQDLLSKESLTRKLELLRAELAGPHPPPPVERLLIERVVACWLHLYHLELVYARKDSRSLALAQHYQGCLDRAHKRYLSAIKTLALMRKLALPVLQVNIARKQVNVAGPCPATASERNDP
jgi:hypothetical protein